MAENKSVLYRTLDAYHRMLNIVQGSQSTISPPLGDSPNLPDIFYVDSGNGNDGNDGRDPGFPLATIDAAINQCTASQGDVILVQPGHSETISTGISLDVIGVAIIGVGEGTLRPQLSLTEEDGDCIDITAANCRVENILFNENGASDEQTGAFINVAAAGATISGCEFNAGQYDTEQITLAAAGDECTIENCKFTVTANGPNAAIEIEDASVDQLVVRNCYFDGGSVTNAWDVGVINSAVIHTLCRIEDNVFNFMASSIGGVQFTAAATGVIKDNAFGNGTIGQMLDPGSCMCVENYEQDAVDESARLFPAVNPSVPVGIDEGEFIPGLGHRVSNALTITQSASPSQDLFTVTGQVLINLFIGEVTTAITNVSIDLTLQVKSTGEDLHAITVIDNDGVGTLYWLDGDNVSVLNGGTGPGPRVAGHPTGNGSLVLGLAGGSLTIEHVIVGTPANSEAITWTLWYYKLEADALVVSA